METLEVTPQKTKHKSLAELQAQNQNKPFYSAQFDFVLKPIETAI